MVPAGGAPPHVLYNALGDTVNVAARLQTYGDLVVGPATAYQVDELFELDELGDLELKGRSERVSAFRVVGIRERPPARLDALLVGREQELAALSKALRGLLEGKGAIVSITGEPGIGKTRLVAEAEECFDGRVRFLTGHAVAYVETIPYWPVRELLRGWLGLGESDPEARVRLELRAQLARTLDDEADAAYPLLATLLGLVLEPEQEQRMRDLARDAVQHETFYWIYQLVYALAQERPLCLVLEDLHWSDEATLSLLDELLPAAEQTAVCFVLVHRSDPDHPAWQLVDRARRRFRGCSSTSGWSRFRTRTRTRSQKRTPEESCRRSSRSSSPSGQAATRTSSGRRSGICASAARSSGRTATSCSSARLRSRPRFRRPCRRGSIGSTPRRASCSRPRP